MRGYLRSLKVTAFALVAVLSLMAAETSQVVAESFLAREEQRLAQLVNAHRASQGISPLATNPALRMVARRHAQRMAMAGYIHHNPSLAQEAEAAIPGYQLIGENVAVGGNVDAVHRRLLESQMHRRTIEAPRFNILGIGAVAGSDGSQYYTQAFAELRAQAPPPPVAPAAPPPSPAAPAPPRPEAAPEPAPPAPQAGSAAARPAQAAAPTAQPAPTARPTSPPSPTPPLEITAIPHGELDASEATVPETTLVRGLASMVGRFLSRLAFWK